MTKSSKNLDSVTQNQLNSLINNGSNEEIRSEALITKIEITPNDNSLTRDVKTALNSSSIRFQEAGLQALDNLLNLEQDGQPYDSNWSNNNVLRQSVETIANNPNADPRT